jgi:hypothetical protein
MVRRLFYSFILMLFSPLLSLYLGLKDSDGYYKRWVLILFITVYGSIIFLHPGTDGYVHQNRVYEQYVNMDFGLFLRYCFDIVVLKTTAVQTDLYIHFVSFLTGRILGSPNLFFVVVSFVFGYFYSGSLFKVIKLLPGFKYNWLFYGFISIFLVWKSIEGINTVRTWTGLWVLFYAVISFYETKKIKYFLLMLLPPYIHVGYYVMAIPAWLVTVGGSWPKAYSVIFLLSFSFNAVNPQSVTEQFEKTEVGAQKVKGYYVEEKETSEDKLSNSLDRGSTWYKASAKAGVQTWAINILAVILIIRGHYINKMTLIEAKLFGIGILTQALSSFSWFIYALHNRTAVIAGVFILASFIMMAQRGGFNSKDKGLPKLEKYLFTLVFLGLVPFFILKISELGEYLSLFLISLPGLIWIASDINMSIKDGFKALIGK